MSNFGTDEKLKVYLFDDNLFLFLGKENKDIFYQTTLKSKLRYVYNLYSTFERRVRGGSFTLIGNENQKFTRARRGVESVAGKVGKNVRNGFFMR